MQRLGPYDLIAELGRGAMGVVYRARHRATGAERALKVLDASGADAEGLARFRREAESLARVDRHPNIVRVHESGAEGRVWYYAMELVRGASLRKLLEKGPLPDAQALDLLAKLAGALDHCHRNGIVHRDLKPDNVLVDEAGEPRLVDFGLVRDLGQQRLTRSGAYLGTPAYMAAEQIRGERATAETDVYALGLLVFETLTGERPYAGRTVTDISAEILEGRAIPLETKRPDLPARLARLVKRCLAVERAQRPKSAAVVAAELEAIARGMRAKTSVPSRDVTHLRRSLKALLGVAAFFALATGALIGRRAYTSWRRAQEERASREALDAAAVAWAKGARRLVAQGAPASLAAIRLAQALAASVSSESAAHVPARELLVARAAAELEEGTDEAAVAAASEALAAKGDEALAREARILRARALLRLGRREEALGDLKTGDGVDSQRLLAWTLLQLGRWDDVLAIRSTDEGVREPQIWARYRKSGDHARAQSEIAQLGGPAQKDAGALWSSLLARPQARTTLVEASDPISDDLTLRANAKRVVHELDAFLDVVVGAQPLENAYYFDREGDLGALERGLWPFAVHGHAVELAVLPDLTRALDRAEKALALLEESGKVVEGEAAAHREALAGRIFIASARKQLVDFAALTSETSTEHDADYAARVAFADALEPFAAELRAIPGTLPPRVEYFRRDLVREDTENRYLRRRATLDDCLADLDAYLQVSGLWPELNVMGLDPRFQSLIRAAGVCARIAGRPGCKDPAPWIARARRYLARLEELDARDTDVLRRAAQTDYLVGLVAGDAKEMEGAALRWSLDAAHAVELLLMGERARREGRFDDAEKLLGQSIEQEQVEQHRLIHDSWFASDAVLAQALVTARDPARRGAAIDALRRLRERLASYPPAFPWLEAEAAKELEAK